MSLAGISSKRDCDIGVAFPISLEWSVVRRQFVALVSPFQGHVACRNLPLRGPLLMVSSSTGVLTSHRLLRGFPRTDPVKIRQATASYRNRYLQ